MSDLADPRNSQVVLIGTGDYRYLGNLPAVRANKLDLRELLTHGDLWGIPLECCELLPDSADAATISRTLRRSAAAVGPGGLLLVYYAGHGLIDPEDGSLILGLSDCEPAVPHEAGLPYEWLRRAVAGSGALRRVVILDCCYSGRASSDMAAATSGTDAVADRAEIDETCLLVSAPRNRPASAPERQRYTAFTGELLRVLSRGVSGAGTTLTIETIWREVRRTLIAKGYERPELRVRNLGGAIPLVYNAATHHRRLAGSLLVAAPRLVDDDLAQAVILILRHNVTGALGVRITAPGGPLPSDFPASWRPLVNDPAEVFDGGPVARDGHIVLVLLRPDSPEPLRFTTIRDRLGTVALSAAPEDLSATVDGMRVFCGYLGWGPGQLEDHLTSGLLVELRQSARAVFSERPTDLWRTLQAAR